MISIREASSENFVDDNFNYPSILESTAHFHFDDRNLDNLRFVKVNSLRAVSEHLTTTQYVDNALDEIKLVRSSRNSDLENNEVSNISHFFLNYDPTKYNHATRKNYVDNAIGDPTLVGNKKMTLTFGL